MPVVTEIFAQAEQLCLLQIWRHCCSNIIQFGLIHYKLIFRCCYCKTVLEKCRLRWRQNCSQQRTSFYCKGELWKRKYSSIVMVPWTSPQEPRVIKWIETKILLKQLMGLSQKVLRDAVSKDVLFNTLLLKKKKWGGGQKLQFPHSLTYLFYTSTL